jgi:type I restriction enzyme S subunit
MKEIWRSKAMAGEWTAPLRDRGWLYQPKYPRHWKRCPLYSLAQWVNGLAFRDVQFSPSGMPVIKIAEIKGGISGQTKFTEQIFDESVRVRPGDLLFSWSGQPETSIDAFWWRGPEGWLNQHVFRVTPADGIDRTFLYYLLRYLKPNFVGIARNKQTTGLGHVTKQDLENIEAAYPPLPEQRAIAHILGTLDDKIELNRRMSETLEAMARALFKAWFVDFEPVRAKMEGRWQRGQSLPGLPAHLYDLFPDRLVDSELGEIPEGWGVVELGLVIEINPPRVLRKGQRAPYLDMASLPTRGHVPNRVVERPYTSGTRFTNGDTLLARITPCLENGKTAFVDFLAPNGVGWGSTEFIVLRPKPPLPAEFGYCLARDPDFREFAIQSMTGTSGRQRVQPEALARYLLVVPSDDVAKAFGALAEPWFRKASASEREFRTLAALRDALLPKLIRGEIRLKDAERFLEERGL